MLKLKFGFDIKCDFEGTTTSAKFSPDNKWICIVQNKQLLLLDLADSSLIPLKLITSHTKPISDIAWSKDSQCIASASDDFTIEITHLTYGSLHRLVGHTAPVISICYNSKGNLLFSASMDESIKIWDTLNGTLMKTMSAHSEAVVSIDLPKEDSSIISSGSYDGLIRIFDTSSGHCLKTLTYDKDWKSETGVVPISQVKFSQNAKYLLVKSLDGIVKIWDCVSGNVVRTFDYNDNNGKLKYSCGMDFLYPKEIDSDPLVVSGYEDGKIYCWNSNSKGLVQLLDGSYHHNSPVISIECKDQSICSLSLSGKLNIWEWIE